MTEFWEPWTPAVGQRVRYVFKPECPGVYGMELARYLNKVPGHPPEFDGRIGTMYEIFEPFTVASRLGTGNNGHRFLVALDPVEPGERPNHIMAAALELAPA